MRSYCCNVGLGTVVYIKNCLMFSDQWCLGLSVSVFEECCNFQHLVLIYFVVVVLWCKDIY